MSDLSAQGASGFHSVSPNTSARQTSFLPRHDDLLFWFLSPLPLPSLSSSLLSVSSSPPSYSFFTLFLPSLFLSYLCSKLYLDPTVLLGTSWPHHPRPWIMWNLTQCWLCDAPG